MKQAYSSRKYRLLIEWIALNDSNGDNDSINSLAGYLTVKMVADCYNLTCMQIAIDVWNMRQELIKD